MDRLDSFEGSRSYISITVLRLECAWVDNNSGMLELLRLCPSLTAFSLCVDRSPATEISSILKESCPNLQTIAGVRTTKYGPSSIRGLTEVQHVELIESIRSLFHYTMLIDDLTLPICRALAAHASSLTSIDLTFMSHTIEGLAHFEVALHACQNLRSLRLANAFHRWTAAHGVVVLRGIWDCVHLEQIEVRGFVRPAPNVTNDQNEQVIIDNEVLMDHRYVKTFGWNVEFRGKEHRRQVEASFVLKGLFAKNNSLPMLKRIILEDIFYSKTLRKI